MTKPQSTAESGSAPAKKAETIGASAIGGAASGAAIASAAGIAAGIGSVVLPVLGTLAGAFSGAAVGWLVANVAAKRRAPVEDSSKRPSA